MKDYRSYMDQVSVDQALHDKIMNRLTQRPPLRRMVLGRYAPICACAVLVFMSIWAFPNLFPSNQVNSPVIQPDDTSSPATAPSLDANEESALFFNRAEGSSEAKRAAIPGYFTQELTPDEIGTLLKSTPDMLKNYLLKGHAGFSGQGILDDVTIVGKDADSGQEIRIKMAKDRSPAYTFRYADEPRVSEINDLPVTAGYWQDPSGRVDTLYYALFTLNRTGYYIEITGENAEEELTMLVNLIAAGTAADLGQITPDYIPAWRSEKLTLSQAQADPDFGAFVPKDMPGFNFESAWRILNQQRDGLRLEYTKGMRYLTLTISRKTTDDEARIVDLSQPETYDLALYPIPRAESVPDELREIVNNPVFKAENLSLKAVKTRAYTVNDAGDDNTGYRMHFSVLYGDMVVEVNVKGGRPEDIFNILQAVPFR